MSISFNRLGAVLLGVLAVCACSKLSGGNGASPASPQAGASPASSAITIAVPANQDVIKIIPLPAGTHSVAFKNGPVSFSCSHLALLSEDGGRSNNFTDADVPANLSMTDSKNSGSYVSVDIACHGGTTGAQLVLTPAP